MMHYWLYPFPPLHNYGILLYSMILIQWNASNVDTLGTWKSVLYREVSSFQGEESIIGTQQSVLNTEMSLFQGYPLIKRGSTVHTSSTQVSLTLLHNTLL